MMGPSTEPTSAGPTPPRSLRPRRPWYLNVSLALAWFVGAGAILMSSMTLSIFHVTPDEASLEIDRKPDLTQDERDRQREAFDTCATLLRLAKNRVIPLAVAELLLGGAIVVFAQRATAGRVWARQALVQLTAAHVVLSGLEWVLTPDLRRPVATMQSAERELDRRELSEGAATLMKLGFGLSAITLLGLTLRGSRAFYVTEGVSEP